MIRAAPFYWALVLSLLVAGCNAGPDAWEVLARSRDAMSQVQSLRWTAEYRQDSAAGGIVATEIGAWGGVDRWYQRLEVLEGSGDLAGSEGQSNGILVVGGRVFTWNQAAGEGEWSEREPGFLPEFHPRMFLSADHLAELRLVEETTMDGLAVFHLSGKTRESRSLPPRFPELPEGPGMVEHLTNLKWFISAEDYRLLQYTAERQTINQGNQQLSNRVTIDFYDFDQPLPFGEPKAATK